MQGPVFCFYEITWLRGPRGWLSGEPVELMMLGFKVVVENETGVIVLSINMMGESRPAGL